MIKSSEFKQRRKRLMQNMKNGSLALLASAPARTRNRDVEYPFRQSSDFYYLTGFDEPESVLVLAPGRKQGAYVLFCRKFDETQALWTGSYAGLDGARETFRADEAYPIEDFPRLLPGLLEHCQRVYYPIGEGDELEHQLLGTIKDLRSKSRIGIKPPSELISLESLLHEQRLFKSKAELAAMRKAGDVSARAHCRAMKMCRPGLYEYQIEAELQHEFARHGLRSVAYPSIVAGGVNACVLHYTENKDALRDGDLLLIDAGAEYQNYAADITRTFPVNGRFSEPQRQLYELVLAAQHAAMLKIKPGKRWNEPHEAAVEVLTEGLVELGLLHGPAQKLINEEGYKKFYMHRTGHWLGMDVHDVGDYKRDEKWRKLEPGMVLTVEPGLYVSPNCDEVDARWRGIGIRIEDDVVVTETGCEVLTSGVPKSVEEIEQLMMKKTA